VRANKAKLADQRMKREKDRREEQSKVWTEQPRHAWEPEKVSGEKGRPKYNDPELMYSEVKIPYEVTCQDPEWLIKKHTGQPLTFKEKELYMEYIFEKESAQL
jgi:hypothetical protein